MTSWKPGYPAHGREISVGTPCQSLASVIVDGPCGRQQEPNCEISPTRRSAACLFSQRRSDLQPLPRPPAVLARYPRKSRSLSCSAVSISRTVRRVPASLWSRALSNSAVDRRVLWNQLPELVKDMSQLSPLLLFFAIALQCPRPMTRCCSGEPQRKALLSSQAKRVCVCVCEQARHAP